MKQRINSLSDYLKNEFGEKTIKLSLDGGFTCPNRDGKVGHGGCIFCSTQGSGDMASTIYEQIDLLKTKWPKARYLAYFQNHTNTYAPVEVLREKFYGALAHDKIEGLVIGTRPDCLEPEIIELLSEINKNNFLWVELGLQTIHEDSANFINRCYNLKVYDEAMENLQKAGIKVVTHLILGLPNETKKDMLDSVNYVCARETWGIKLHLLNVVKGSPLSLTHRDYQPFDSLEEYVSLVVDLLEKIPPHVVIHRLTGDAPRKTLISPPWSYKKRTILNGINQELVNRNSYQGKLW